MVFFQHRPKENMKKLMIHSLKTLVVSGLLVGLSATAVSARQKVDAKIPGYSKVSGISGNLDSVGSDTLNNLMTFWAEAFRKYYPNVNIQIEGKGSSTAPPALINGSSQLGPMSRKMKAKESQAFEQKYGFKETRFAVAIDSLAVYVNKDNPIDGLTLKEVDGIFSRTRKSGSKDITNWTQVGGRNGQISLYGRNSASGTYGYFKKKALFKGDYRSTVKEQPGSASVVMSVTEDMNGIGYSGIGYKTSGVKALALSKKGGKKYEPTPANALSGKYPLARALYVNIVKAPNKPAEPIIREFLKLVYSKEGQQIVIKDGYIPLPYKAIERELAKLK